MSTFGHHFSINVPLDQSSHPLVIRAAILLK